MTTVQKWTGRETRALRQALRMSTREFAARLGITERTIAKWEAPGGGQTLRPSSQAMLDTMLGNAPQDARTRFETALGTGASGESAAGSALPGGRSSSAADFIVAVERHMHARGMSVRATARAAGYSDHTLVSKVLNGHKPVTPYLASRLDRALGAGGEITAAAHAVITAAHAVQGNDILGSSLETLRQHMNDVFSRGSVTDATLDDWERTAIRYARATRDRPASLLIADLCRDLQELNGMLAQPLPVSALRRLTRVAAQMSGLMCLAFCILDDRPAFRRWARTARLAGSEAGDPETLSWVLAQEAHGHYYSGDVPEAIDVARRAYETSQAPCTGAALGAALEARAQAALGRDEETRNALARAEETLSCLGGDVLIPSAFGYSEASFRFHEGNAYTHLRDVKSAFRALDRALKLCAPDNYTDWAMTRLDRAQCLIYANDISSGLEYAIDTLTSLDEPKRRGIISLRAQQIARALPRKAGSLAASHDLDELLMLTAGTSAGDC